MPTAIAEAEADSASIPEDVRSLRAMMEGPGQDIFYPLTSREAFAFAAARGDHGSLKILDSICGRFGCEEPEPCSADYLHIVKTVQDMVAANDVTDIKDVRKVLSPTDRVRLRSVWRAMRDAKLLTVETLGAKVLFHREAPAPAPFQAKPVAFRKGKPVAETALISRPPHLKPWDKNLPVTPVAVWPTATPTSTPVPKELRRTRKSDVASAGTKSWLQTGPGKRGDGTRYVPTSVINVDGSPGPVVDLDEGRLRSNPQGDCGISVDRDVNVRIYTPDAEQVFSANLAALPEVRDTMRAFGDRSLQSSSAVRSVHASLAAERLVVSVIDRVFVYSFSGDVVAAFRLAEDVQEVRGGELVVATSLKPDWAYFVQLAAEGDSLFIGAYSGLLLHLSFNGDLIGSWSLPSAPYLLRETADGVAGLAGEEFFRAGRGDTVHCEHADLMALPEMIGSHVILDGRHGTGVFDLDEFEGRMVELPRPRTAAYVANGTLVMETATARFSF